MIKTLDKSDITSNPFVVSQKWRTTNQGNALLLYEGLTLSPLPTPPCDEYYIQTITTSGGTGPYTYELIGGSLPPGFSLDSNGNISGTFIPCEISLDDTLPDGIAMFSYSGLITSSGCISPYTYSLVAGELPTGLALDSVGGIVGTPTATGSFSFDVKSTSSDGNSGVREYTVDITDPCMLTFPTGCLRNYNVTFDWNVVSVISSSHNSSGSENMTFAGSIVGPGYAVWEAGIIGFVIPGIGGAAGTLAMHHDFENCAHMGLIQNFINETSVTSSVLYPVCPASQTYTDMIVTGTFIMDDSDVTLTISNIVVT